MKSKHWKIILIALALINVVSGVFAVFAGSNPGINRWELVGEPPEPAIRIAGLTFGSGGGAFPYLGRDTHVYVESTAGKFYKCCYGSDGTAWARSRVDEWDAPDFWEARCPQQDHRKYHLSGEKDRLSADWCGEYDFGTIVYALRDDGMVWQRKIYSAPMTTFWLQFFAVSASVLLLFVIYIVNTLFQAVLLFRKQSAEET